MQMRKVNREFECHCLLLIHPQGDKFATVVDNNAALVTQILMTAHVMYASSETMQTIATATTMTNTHCINLYFLYVYLLMIFLFDHLRQECGTRYF